MDFVAFFVASIMEIQFPIVLIAASLTCALVLAKLFKNRAMPPPPQPPPLNLLSSPSAKDDGRNFKVDDDPLSEDSGEEVLPIKTSTLRNSRFDDLAAMGYSFKKPGNVF